MITDPQVLDFIARTEAAYPPEANGASAADNRRFYDAMCAVFRAPRPPGLPVQDRRIGGVPCRIYGADIPVAVVYVHGGGFVVGGLDSHDDVCAEIADATGLQVVAVDYRLAPEHRWPAQIADVQAVWDALDRPAVIAGDSAGGLLAAALCLSRRGARQPLGQVLVYPGLGGDGSAPSYRENAEAPLLRTEDLAGYHAALHGEGPVDPLAHPLQADSLAGLAPAFVVTADVDPLRDDGRDYVRRLRAEGVAAHWRNEPELPHGYLRARRHSDRARRSFQAILAAIQRFAGPPR
ncbi:alpha/beta hydrolase [Paracoccus denitrificans]|jgi:acetyl esterase|uniref:Alpha/beta hydrolase fold-3 domain protein n=1 Tax=Paracoccus denitrificans (strain Pd 1222) TaxID=318586 RepID=A1BC93_PARDP|nr:alpha/beta hydrolase [Paracoccus denitrificans]ABL73137.1 Alpha/beta hydrolase fold-3 domain protein [Paracoccus denitrificans PD1222]MBB4628618.1 acetyl esterase [Paracoccus denitrificans]MCU7429675.1 alpha/beta hydrolase [Paracoccus denitrificans]QAR29519.1 alpha/beta hydrolase [Paracoccus denitrificans]UPV98714.1 alpha/beta hydrolase [Paracoccus denitrificans]